MVLKCIAPLLGTQKWIKPGWHWTCSGAGGVAQEGAVCVCSSGFEQVWPGLKVRTDWKHGVGVCQGALEVTLGPGRGFGDCCPLCGQPWPREMGTAHAEAPQAVVGPRVGILLAALLGACRSTGVHPGRPQEAGGGV